MNHTFPQSVFENLPYKNGDRTLSIFFTLTALTLGETAIAKTEAEIL
ncbi:hypothetical protein QM565_29440 [Geitlerinema splendidum]|nr:hypothetical protein [Geitlerinema splendidum]